jgi:hypothetical protein
LPQPFARLAHPLRAPARDYRLTISPARTIKLSPATSMHRIVSWEIDPVSGSFQTLRLAHGMRQLHMDSDVV